MKKIVLIVSLILVFAFSSVNAQTEVSPEKQKAISELSALMNANNNAEDLVKAMLEQTNSINRDVVDSIIKDRNDLTSTEKVSLKKSLLAEYEANVRRFQNKFIEKLDYNAMISEIMIIVYDKYYTLEDINNLIAFYKTPTGQKTLKTMQPVMIETMQLVQKRLVPKIPIIMQELSEETRLELSKKADELKPRKKTNK